MPSLLYDQRSGVTAEALEAARRREEERARARPAAYSPSMSGLNEREMESTISRAQIAHDDVDDAVEGLRGSTQLRLRAPMSNMNPVEGQPMQLRQPMTGAPQAMAPQAPSVARVPSQEPPAMQPKAMPSMPAPTADPRDQEDRDRAAQLRRQRLGLLFAGIGGAVFGDPNTNQQRMSSVTGALQSIDPNAPLANIDARAQQRREDEEAARQASIEDEQRALESEYRRTLMRSMDVNSDRREFEMQRRGTGDERLYDPAHPLAQARRNLLRRIIATAPGGVGVAFEGLNLDDMGARDLQGVADQVLRRIGQVPNRARNVDEDELARIVAGLDEQAPQAAAVEAPMEAPPATPRAVRIARARQAGAPAAPAEAVAPEQPAAPTGLVDRRGNPPPWAGRDRTIAEINAESIIAREPNARSWPEALAAARALERSRTREAGALAGGVDSRSREAQFQQTGQTGTFTEADIARAARITQPLERQSRQLRGLLSRVSGMDDATFRLAMQSGNPARALSFNASDFASQYAAYANPELRERSGAAVTDHEYQRFVEEMGAGRYNSKAQFIAALNRVLNEVRSNSRTFGLRPDIVAELRRRAGGR